MELVYETEMNEKGTAKLFLRRRGFLEELREFFAPLSVLWPIGAIYYLFISGYTDGGGIAEFSIAILGTLIFLFGFFIVDRVVVQKVRRAYRQRKTNQVEYRLTDDKLAFTVGETTFSSPWNKVAKKFSIDRKAIYLYGKDLPFEAQCIPEWRGHGVERKELVAILKKAGLKKMSDGWLKFLVGLDVTFILITCYFYIGGIEWGDWTIPDEAELRLEKRDVPDEDNAYLALIALTNLYRVADNDQENEKSGDDSAKVVSDKDFVKYYGNLLNSEGWEDWAAVRSDPASPKRAEKILADNVRFFDAFRAALSFKYFVDTDARLEDAKRVKEGKPPWVLSYLPRYKPFIEFAQLVALRAQAALEHDDVESAVSAIGEIHALAQLFKVNNESFVAYLVGALIEKISFRKICDVVAMDKATGEVVERFSKMVAVSEANAPTAWKRALTAEASRHSEGVEWICDHPTQCIQWLFLNFDEYGNITSPSLLCRILSNWPGFAKFSFHRRELLYRQAMLDRALIAGDDDLMEMILHEMPRNPLLPNFAGNFVVYSLCPYLNSDDAKSGSLDRIRPRLVLAAEKWRRAHGGANPPTLDALVPDYLAAVPTDPWSKSGEPIKYDASTGVAWSVGKEGTYDYRKIAKDHAAGSKASVDVGTQEYAFRLDGKPINNETNNAGGAKHQASPLIRKDDSTSTTQTQYAAEAIPVLGNLRTKIGLYQYEKGILPCIVTNEVANGEDTGRVISPQIETWVPADRGTVADVSANSPKAHVYKIASSALPSDEPPLKGLAVFDSAKGLDVESRHLGVLVDIDPLDLLGKYSRPNDYQYLVMRNGGGCWVYFVGCFGDGNGLPAGTGYAVCEISSPSTGRKYGFWERYRSTGDTQICFTSSTSSKDGRPLGCYVPEKTAFDNMIEKDTLSRIVDTMKKQGWNFGGQEQKRGKAKGNDVDATNDRRTKTPDGIQGSGNEIVNGVKWTFVITNGNASVSVIPPSFTAIPRSTSGELTIPSILGGCPVTSIGKFSFNCCDKITYVKIPDSVTSIGSWAFQLCTDLKGVIFSGNAPRLECGAFNSVASDCTVYVPKGSKGWGCTIPGTWNGLKICYGTPECDVEPEVQPKEKLRKEENPPADVRRRHWLVPVASCRTAMSGRCDSRAFISGMDRGLAEGEVISPSVGKCGYRVLSISDNCVWFEAFYDDEPPEDKLPRGPWPDFSRIDTIPPVPPPGRLMLGKRQFWPGDAIKLPNSGWYLKVDDFLEGRGAVFRLLDSSMRPVRELLCVIVREER